MIEVTYKNFKITGIVTAVRVEKNMSSAGSEAEITAICSPGDRYLPVINPACGDSLSVSWDGSELFSGTIERLTFSAGALSVTMLCYDAASMLSKNEIYSVFSGAPGVIAEKACAAAGVKLLGAWSKAGTVFIPASCALSTFSIIRRAYGGQCVTECEGGGVHILKPGERKCTAELGKLLSVKSRHSAESMVNRAEVIGYMGRREATAENAADIERFGVRKRVYSLAGARKTAAAQAGAHISGMAREAEIKVYGIANVKCGDGLALSAGDFGIDGEWTVTSVAHEISGGFAVSVLGLIKPER